MKAILNSCSILVITSSLIICKENQDIYATNAKGEGNEEVDDEVSQNSSSSVESSVDSKREEIPKFSSLPPNVMEFLSYIYSID
jgi:hypothetical protein